MHHTTPQLRQLRRVIGENIHHLRVTRRLTLRKLTRLTGIPEPLLDQYELGKNDIRLTELLKLACALHVEANALLVQSPG